MKRVSALLVALRVMVGAARAVDTRGSVGRGTGILVPGTDSNPCPPAELCLNFDGSAENAYCWQYLSGQPYYGAFAECWDVQDCPACLCGIELILTSIGHPCIPCDLYVWEDDGGIPGNVLSVTAGADPCPVATWPELSAHDFAIEPLAVCGVVWFGYWADFSERPCGYFIAADTNGFGGCPMTYGPETRGWQRVDYYWGPTQSIGIGAWITPGACEAVPVGQRSWGAIKELYR